MVLDAQLAAHGPHVRRRAPQLVPREVRVQVVPAARTPRPFVSLQAQRVGAQNGSCLAAPLNAKTTALHGLQLAYGIGCTGRSMPRQGAQRMFKHITYMHS